ncbi:MAG: hypothetical protein HY913_16165 [Desulfomonile tiedjei]|nr:hypothetical protein [Desulfomonile tiedjei]
MDYPPCAPRVYRALAFAVIFLGLVAVGCYWIRDDLVQFFMTRPSINAVIFGLGILGLCLSFVELMRLLVQARSMDSMVEALSPRSVASRQALEEVLNEASRGAVRDRSLRSIKLMSQDTGNASLGLSLLSDADAEAAESRGALARYILGVMVFLGLIGTFWGVLITVGGVQNVLQALDPSRVDDPVAFISQLKSSVGGMLGGLSTAFSTSLFGLAGSVILGFVEVQTRQARSSFLADLDRFVVTILMPAARQERGVVTVEPVSKRIESGDGELYLVASQQALGENLRRLTEVIALQGTTDEKITDSIVEIKGMIESLGEEELRSREAAVMANQMRQSLLEHIDTMGRQIELLVKETRLARESSERMAKTVLDRLKLEGEITNKTLSMGFGDLVRKLDSIRRKGDPRAEPKKDESP